MPVSPRLPRLLGAPFSLVPDSIISRLVTVVLNNALAEPLRVGELDFLRQRSLLIRLVDASVSVHLTVSGQVLVAASPRAVSDLSIEASVYDFLVLVGQQEDPDTLVFQRRLVVQGDTELGLEVKNFLDGLDVESIGLYRKLSPVLGKLLPVYRQVFS